jgi:hypothetical protein
MRRHKHSPLLHHVVAFQKEAGDTSSFRVVTRCSVATELAQRAGRSRPFIAALALYLPRSMAEVLEARVRHPTGGGERTQWEHAGKLQLALVGDGLAASAAANPAPPAMRRQHGAPLPEDALATVRDALEWRLRLIGGSPTVRSDADDDSAVDAAGGDGCQWAAVDGDAVRLWLTGGGGWWIDVRFAFVDTPEAGLAGTIAGMWVQHVVVANGDAALYMARCYGWLGNFATEWGRPRVLGEMVVVCHTRVRHISPSVLLTKPNEMPACTRPASIQHSSSTHTTCGPTLVQHRCSIDTPTCTLHNNPERFVRWWCVAVGGRRGCLSSGGASGAGDGGGDTTGTARAAARHGCGDASADCGVLFGDERGRAAAGRGAARSRECAGGAHRRVRGRCDVQHDLRGDTAAGPEFVAAFDGGA